MTTLIKYGIIRVRKNKREVKKKNVWLKWGAVAACLWILVGIIAMTLQLHGAGAPKLILSDKSTAKVSYGYEKESTGSGLASLMYYTEEEMFAREKMYIFRGKVANLTNITIDFNGEKEVRCIATVTVRKVYKGKLTVGKQVRMLLPCGIDIKGGYVEDTGVITQLKIGMEGIFMPWIYDDESYMEMNGARIMWQDLADCGLGDGVRWVFLSTEKGVLFLRDAYPGAKNASDLDDIEAYVLEQIS